MTKKLYDVDSHLYAFDAVVQSCTPQKNRYAVILDQTAFFPEGGGQSADTGMLGGAFVSDVQEENGVIVHYTDGPVSVGETVHGELNAAQRFRRMQNHSGEHIVSGIVHRLFGLDNVGFHLGDDDMTVDYNGVLTRADLDRVEAIANETVAQNIEITARYPDESELQSLVYRSKLDLRENVRIVTIGDVDCCACCAPHVSRTGEIGCIKILDFEHYKGGVRCHMLCGSTALEDYRIKYANVQKISLALCVPQPQTAEAVEHLIEAGKQKDFEIVRLRRALAEDALQHGIRSASALCFFANSACDTDSLRYAVNLGMRKAKLCAGFIPTEGGYRYCIGSDTINMREYSKQMNASLLGRGGGQSSMIQGTAAADRETILAFFEKMSV